MGDYDGDGRADIALLETNPDTDTAFPESTLSLYLGTAEGFTEDGTTQQFSTGYGPWMETGDFDGDGPERLADPAGGREQRADHDRGRLPRGRHAADELGPVQPAGAGRALHRRLGVADLNGDGRDDVVNVDPARFAGKSIVMVALSTGDQFEQASERACWSGRSLPSRTPSFLGNTFP